MSAKANISVRAMVQTLKDENQDFEWYPTTKAMIDCIKTDIGDSVKENYSVLDCGAGDGRVLMELTEGSRYAIEKSVPLLAAMDKSIYVVGTDFFEQTLIDKRVDLVVGNPPYQQFVEWTIKIIREANAGGIYLIIPERWKRNDDIQNALKARRAKAEVIAEFDFLNAERQARAKVNIVKIDLGGLGRYNFGHPKCDPFELWFEDNFKIQIGRREESKFDYKDRMGRKISDRVNGALVEGSDIVAALVSLYQHELGKMMANYKAIETLDPDLLQEMNVNIESLKGALRSKIEGLKDIYWRELFGKLGAITDKLASKSRSRLLDVLQKHIHVDFTESNARAIALWSLKNANSYFDSQLIDIMECMIERANVTLYKSNQKTFTEDQWRYVRCDKQIDRFVFDYRVVLTRCGGIFRSQWSFEKSKNGLDTYATEFLGDLITVAGNVGFDTRETTRPEHLEWSSGKRHVFVFRDHRDGKEKPLFEAKAFLNKNIHIRFNPRLILRLNCEFGRLKGWLKCKEQAVDELSVIVLGEDSDLLLAEEIESAFGSNLKLANTDIPLLSSSSTRL